MIEDGQASLFGPEYKALYLKLVMTDRATTNGLPPVQSEKLHRSSRTSSGFVGVYTNGKGFRAMARASTTGFDQKSIGTFPSAEMAAWARYLHYQRLGLPYGEIEGLLSDPKSDVNYWRDALRLSLGREPTDAEAVAEANLHRAEMGVEPISWQGAELPEPVFKPIVATRRGRVISEEDPS